MLGIKPDIYTHTSDSFDLIMEYCEKMIRMGKAYVDNTDPETMKKEREERVESACRSNCEFQFVHLIVIIIDDFIQQRLRRTCRCGRP
jgi:glutamyl/glutaminyl-tRNA synthetase